MNLISHQFCLLLILCVPFYYIVKPKFQNAILLFANIIFYFYAGVGALLLLIASVIISYFFARIIESTRSPLLRKTIYIFALILSIGVLCFYKYANSFFTYFEQVQFNAVLMPLGLSFYSFMLIAYLTDIYTKLCPAEKNFLCYANFISFFPIIASGPVERSTGLLPQFKTARYFNYDTFALGCTRIVLGVFKKFVIANLIGIVVDRVYSDLSAYAAPFLIMAAFAFAIQIYYDFSGYSDIAIGLALVFGLKVMENFARPYFSTNFSTFWKRWHISLSAWLQDYIFMPLVWGGWQRKIPFIGSKLEKQPVLISLCCVFIISGLWHGDTLPFLIWGILHAIYRLGEELLHKIKKPRKKQKTPIRLAKMAVVFVLWCFSLIFFRANTLDIALQYFTGLAYGWEIVFSAPNIISVLTSLNMGKEFFLVVTGGILVVELLNYTATKYKTTTCEYIRSKPAVARIIFYYILLTTLAFYGVFGTSSFLYFAY